MLSRKSKIIMEEEEEGKKKLAFSLSPIRLTQPLNLCPRLPSRRGGRALVRVRSTGRAQRDPRAQSVSCSSSTFNRRETKYVCIGPASITFHLARPTSPTLQIIQKKL